MHFVNKILFMYFVFNGIYFVDKIEFCLTEKLLWLADVSEPYVLLLDKSNFCP